MTKGHLINLCLQSNTCVINGRIASLLDGYTSIFHRGTAVVHYMISPHNYIQYFQKFELLLVSDTIRRLKVIQNVTNRVSDHSVIKAVVQLNKYVIECDNTYVDNCQLLWKLGIISPLIIPIPKSSTNDPRITLTYRGISLLPVSGKLFTAAISSHPIEYCEKNGVLADEQSGFRPNHSTLNHIFSLHNVCFTRKHLKSDTYLTFIDYQKDFDYVEHESLYHYNY